MPVMLLCGCSTMPNSEDYSEEQNSRFVFVKSYTADGFKVVRIMVDKETKVMYMYYGDGGTYGGTAGLTALLNADGTPMIWEGEL